MTPACRFCHRETCERELQACLNELAESGSAELQDFAVDSLASCKVSSDECRMLRMELKLQVTGTSQVHSNLRAYVQQDGAENYAQVGGKSLVVSPRAPPRQPRCDCNMTPRILPLCPKECDLVGSEIQALREDLDLQISQLAEDVQRLTAELAAPGSGADEVTRVLNGGDASGSSGPGRPLGLPCPPLHAIDDASDDGSYRPSEGALVAYQGGATISHATTSYNASRDGAELEEAISRYPLASEGVKASIREVRRPLRREALCSFDFNGRLMQSLSFPQVHAALQERFLERLETWRLEWAMSGLGSATGE